MSATASGGPLRVGLYGFFGMGNFGNEGSLTAVLRHVRSRHPDAEFLCLGADPAEIERQHGIAAARLMAFRAPPGDTRPVTQARKALGRLRDVPRTWALVGRVDVVIVPGMGVFENRLTPSPWGLPYWMALTMTACRLRGRPTALVGVGEELMTGRAARLLMRHTISSATHVTYRDAPSRAAARAIGALGRPGTVGPDVAFDLPDPDGVRVRPGHVVVGVMRFLGGAEDPTAGTEKVDTYVERMAGLVTRLLDEGRTVTVVLGDLGDGAVAERLARQVHELRPAASDRLRTSEAADLTDLMSEMASAEVVVASRYHNVICAVKAGRPVVSLSYAGKNAAVLEAFGLGEFDQPIDAFDVDRVVADVERLCRSQQTVHARIEQVLARVERDVAEHLTEMSSAVLAPWAGVGRGRSVRKLRSVP